MLFKIKVSNINMRYIPCYLRMLLSNWFCGIIKYTRIPLSCDTINQINRCWTQGLSASSSAYTIYSSCSTSTPTHSYSAGYFEIDWWRPRKGGSAPNYLCMFCHLFYYPSYNCTTVYNRGRYNAIHVQNQRL